MHVVVMLSVVGRITVMPMRQFSHTAFVAANGDKNCITLYFSLHITLEHENWLQQAATAYPVTTVTNSCNSF